MSDQYAWGIIGTGGIAKTFAKALAASRTGQLLAVGSRAQQTAEAFGKEFMVPRCYGSYEALLADKDVQLIYNSLPNHMHLEWTIRCAEAGKHILCEKPLTLNYAEAMTLIEHVREHGVFLMEAFMYRCHPQTAKLVQLIREKTIGDVRLIQAHFAYNMGPNYQNIRLRNDAGGGAIMDVGCYCASMARLLAGAALGLPGPAEPLSVQGAAHIGAVSRVDEWSAAVLKFPGDILATLHTACELRVPAPLQIFGSQGHLVAPFPWFPGPDEDHARITIHRDGQPEETISAPGRDGLYTIEADTVARHIASRQAPPPCMTWEDSLGNMRTLDLWRRSAGVAFDAEQPAAAIPTARGRPLAVRPDHKMKYGRVEGVAKPVSRIVMGTILEGASITSPHAHLLFDDFYEHGGNAFDTAWVYNTERYLGQWLRNRGLREQVVVIGKGAATPYCTPEGIDTQLRESLDRLQSDYFDICLLHRDNLDVPIGELVDCLNGHLRAGRIRAFGGSNWTLERVAAANRYAKRKGCIGFAAISDNFSLARMVAPVWPGCVAVSDPKSRAWLKRNKMPNFAWSSQGRGFFRDDTRVDNRADTELVRCWFSDDNFRRLERARELGRRKGVPAINIAAAYVLGQPFPSFALIGPRTFAEGRSALGALDVELTPAEVRWLDGGKP
jgi:predicted dehydrogenase/aryl-alcohol dehydrogenase-like predicted oxidoreductase